MIKRDKPPGENYKFVPPMTYENNITNENTANAANAANADETSKPLMRRDKKERRRRAGVALQKLERQETALISRTMPSAGIRRSVVWNSLSCRQSVCPIIHPTTCAQSAAACMSCYEKTPPTVCSRHHDVTRRPPTLYQEVGITSVMKRRLALLPA